MMDKTGDCAWFAPKRRGYGAGCPIAWQGWALIGVMLVAEVVVAEPLLAIDWRYGLAAGLGVLLPFQPLLRAKTRGGWRWRWG